MNTPHDTRAHVRATYLSLCRGMALIAFAFPIWLLFTSYGLGREPAQTSISAFYYTAERDVLTGVLCAIGSFLFLFKGYTDREDWILNYAGVAAVMVAMFETTAGGDCSGPGGFSVHGFAAVTFFLAIAVVAIFTWKTTLPKIKNDLLRDKLKRRYLSSAGIMIVTIGAATVGLLLPKEARTGLCELNAIFWLEALGVWGFSWFWFARTDEIAYMFDHGNA